MNTFLVYAILIFDYMNDTKTICNLISLTASAVVDATRRRNTLSQALNHLNDTYLYGNLSPEVKKHFEHIVVRAQTVGTCVSEQKSDMMDATYWVVGKHYESKQIISVQCPQDEFDKLVRMGFEKTKGDAIYDSDHGTITVPYFVYVPIINPGNQEYKIM
jgi:hypothetical protein